MGGFTDLGALTDGPSLSDVGGSAPIDLTSSIPPITSETTNFSTVDMPLDTSLIPPDPSIATLPLSSPDWGGLGMVLPGSTSVTDLPGSAGGPTLSDLAASTQPLTAANALPAAGGALSSLAKALGAFTAGATGAGRTPVRVISSSGTRPATGISLGTGSITLILILAVGIAVLFKLKG